MSDQIDSKQFRNALGRFATGVTVVTASDLNDGFVGTTASSFNSVSMDPPLILWSIDKGARSLPAYQNAEHFVVNVLAADQVGMSNHFARQQEDKFVDIGYALNSRGVPVLPGCSAVFHCKNRFQYEGGDHIIIVGEVEEFTASERNSLLFHGGSYAVSEKHPVTAPANADSSPEFRSFADDYLEYLLARSFYQMHQKMAATRANEAEALGTFSAQEALTLKSALRRIIAWTSEVPPGIDGQQQSLTAGSVS